VGKGLSLKRRFAWALVGVPVLAIMGLTVAAAAPLAAHKTAGTRLHYNIAPRAGTNNLDCNGWSPKYKAVAPSHRAICTDPRGAASSEYSSAHAGYANHGRFVDNGHYVGHDEPSVKFISSAAGSGNTMTYYMQLPRDPKKAATNSGSVVKYGELSIAPWFGLPICDPGSYPQNPCIPHSDANSGSFFDPNAAGSAFMELQFYPPGFTPFADNASCSKTQWCSALTIDSLESKLNFADLNPNCVEPQNFAFLQRNGVPTGPPGPQLADAATVTPNSDTLKLNPGDVLKVSITDPLTGPGAGFTTTVKDETTGKTGYMVASASNGFMSTDYITCAGTPFTFHAEYNTARQQNQVPWAALEGGVLMQQETGHSEVCASLSHRDPVVESGLVDTRVYDTCKGGNEEGKHDRGEGPCNGVTGVCQNAKTEGVHGPVACPTNNFASGALCEFADGNCMPQGTRTVIENGVRTKETSPVNFCADDRFQNGDLDFDGIPYQRHRWPDGSKNTPTVTRYVGPFLANGDTYPTVQFETDIAGSEILCNVVTGVDCLAPPLGAKFYPYWTLTNKQTVGHDMFPSHACIWNFGSTIRHITTNNLGRDAEYGVSDIAEYGGTVISPLEANPEINGTCPAL
jgi:hypothetical protein